MSRFTPPASVRTPAQIQSTFEEVAEAIEDTLSRKGDSPNQMETDLDMNGNAILNIGVDPSNPDSLITASYTYSKAEIDTKDANILQEAKDYVDAEIIGTPSLSTDDVDNDSSVVGATATIALNNLGTDVAELQSDVSGLESGLIAGLATKANKIISPVVNNFVKQDALGNVVDAGVSQTSFATSTQGSKADSAVQPGDNISSLTNDSGFISGISSLSINALSDVDTTGKSTGRILEFDASGNLVVGDKSASASTSFLGLSDTPSSYVGQSGKIISVNATEDGVEFTDVTGAGLVDSVFGRVGVVTAQSGDYNSDQVTNNSTVTGATVSDALETLDLSIPDITGKMDKVGSPTLNAIVVQDASGNATNSGVLVADLATATQGSLADSAVQPGDLATVATTGAYSDLSGIPSSFTPSAHTHVKADITDFSDGDYATAAQGALAASAVQPADISNVVRVSDFGVGATTTSFYGAGADVNTVSDTRIFLAEDQFPTNWEAGGYSYPSGLNFYRSSVVRGQFAQGWSASQGAVLRHRAGNVAGDGFQAWQTVWDSRNLVDPVESSELVNYATATQGAKADSALQPGDNISELVNNSGFISDITAESIDDLADVDTTGKSVGRILEFDASGNLIVGDKSATASTSFLGLTDTPGSYTGQSGKVVTVNGTEDGVEFTEIAGSGLVDSVFGRIGPVTAQAGDYNSNQVNNSSSVTGSSVTDALNTLQAAIPNVSTKMDKISSAVVDAIVIQDAFGNAKNSNVLIGSLLTTDNLSTVAVSGDYNDVLNAPHTQSVVDLLSFTGSPSDGQVWYAGAGYSGNGVGRGTWYATTDTGHTPSQSPAVRGRAELTDADGRIWRLRENNINVDMLGAAEGGDVTAAINAAFGEVRNSTDSDATGFMVYTEASVSFSCREYEVSSVNCTNIKSGRNHFVYGNGATLRGNTANKHIFDAIGSRWLWVQDLTLRSDVAIKAKSGLIIGPIGTETCGNNKFYNVQCLGDFSQAPMINMGSETTQWYSCRFSNESTVTTTHAAYMDGYARVAYTSDYVTVTRGTQVGVSFTNNFFYSCQFRHLGGGHSTYLSRSSKWTFDEGCYFLSYAKAGIEWYTSSVADNDGVVISGGLFETVFTTLPNGNPTTGLQNCILFTGDGTDSAVSGLVFRSTGPHAKDAIFGCDGTTGVVRFIGADVKLANIHRIATTSTIFDTTNTGVISFKGDLKCDVTSAANLDNLINFNGRLEIPTSTGFARPTGSSAYSVAYVTDATQEIVGLDRVGYGGYSGASLTGTDLEVASRMNVYSSSTADTCTVFSHSTGSFLDAEEIFIRFSGTGSLTFNVSSDIRTISGANVTLTQDDVIQFVRISGNIFQQTGGKQ